MNNVEKIVQKFVGKLWVNCVKVLNILTKVAKSCEKMWKMLVVLHLVEKFYISIYTCKMMVFNLLEGRFYTFST